MARERGWHCVYTHSCIYESVSEPVRIPGTHMVACAPHASLLQLQRFHGGRDGSEAVSGIQVARDATQEGQS